MRLFVFTLCVLLAFGTYCQADTNPDIGEIRTALQNRQFEKAVKLIDSALAKSNKEQDFLLYLKGLSSFYNKSFAESIKYCDEVISEYDSSPWYRKAVFLKAQCYVKTKEFEKAEKIYSAEARRLLSKARKEKIAKIYFRFAEAVSKKPDKDDLDAPPPNYKKAYELYSKALELEIARGLKDEVMFRLGRMSQLDRNYEQAISDYRQYLTEFDSNWLSAVNSPRLHSSKSENLSASGKHIYSARYYLAECQLTKEQRYQARINLEDLLRLIPKSESDYDKIVRDARLLIIKTYNFPEPKNEDELELGVKTAKSFLTDFPNDPRSISLAYEIGQAYEKHGKSSEAIKTYRDYLERKLPELDKIESLSEKDEKEEPAERFKRLRMSATYKIGKLLFSQKNYDGAVEMWNQYISQFPEGPQWTKAQQGVIDAEFEMGVELLAEKRYENAVQVWDEFLEKHPLDHRSRQIMFTYGQLHYHREEYQKAIAEWEKLVNKYPNTQESSLALLKIGLSFEEKLGELDKALSTYRKLNWGTWKHKARRRITIMTRKKLGLTTERTFRTNETARVKISLRNIDKLTVDIYKLDLEAYWRKMHGIGSVEELDLVLIAPDKTWEYKITDYQKYKTFEKEIEIPMDGPGVYAVHVGDEDLEATTLVIRSDIELILKTSRREALVFVEDMLNRKPVSDARVLVSDGTKVVCEGKTNQDGIFHKKLDELKDASDVTAFVVSDGNVAADSLNTSDLNLSSGLSPRGYIYTDRPAYRPGQTVSIRGIVRDVREGSYTVSPNESYEVAITDSQGRLLRSEKLQLSKFGTFHTEMILDDNVPVGEYRIVVQHVDHKDKTFTGTFQLQKFKLEKMKLEIDFPRRVYFRGEEVEATFTASYYYGQPVSGRDIRYKLPDGRSFTKTTDAEGKLKVRFDTTPMLSGNNLVFNGRIEGENVQVSGSVFLVKLGFRISVEPSAEVVLSGEPFEVFVKTKSADNKPVGKELTLKVYRKTRRPSHPILSQVPWINRGSSSLGEVKVEEHKVVTDEKTGKGKITLSLEKGGKYTLRVYGTDRFDHVVVGSGNVFVSDDEDDVKLRIFAERSELKVGETERIGIHSRLQSSLALVTFEGEGIIGYRIMSLNQGMNELEFSVGHEHFPNFHISVTAIDDPKSSSRPQLRTAGKDFTVERKLIVSLEVNEFYRPGEEAEVKITTTDQLGNPVSAELSLALVDSALFARFPDKLRSITDFFNEGIRRDAAMRTISSCRFHYQPPTRRVLKDVLEEGKRLEMEAKHVGYLPDDTLAKPVAREPIRKPVVKPVDKAKITPSTVVRTTTFESQKLGKFGRAEEELSLGASMITIRKEFVDAGYWIPSIVTDVDGSAVAKIPMPEKTTQWRLTARGCTVETLVGQTKVNTITRKNFFLDVKLPSIVTEGDEMRVLARIHNLTDFAGDAELILKARKPENETRNTQQAIRKQVQIKKNGTTEVIFDPVKIPAGRELQVELTARAGEMTDGISRTIPIRPWGMELADSQGSVSSGDETIFLQLPPDQQYTSKRLTINVGPSVKRLVFDLAMNRRIQSLSLSRSRIPPVPGDTGSDLLAASYALAYLKKVGGSQIYNSPRLQSGGKLIQYTRSLVARLVVSQRKNGGWSWCYGDAESDVYVSSRSLWALAETRHQGVKVNPQTIEKAISYLKDQLTRVEQNDYYTKAVILHALSHIGEADFTYANRLYRNRNQMSPAALAYSALLFSNLNRNEIGSEILDALESKKIVKIIDNRSVSYWLGDEKSLGGKVEVLSGRKKGDNHAWTASKVETTALALLAMESIRPGSPLVKKAVDYLLSQRTFYGFSPYKAKGPAVAALANYYGKTQFVKNDYRLTISVNGEKVKNIEVQGEQQTLLIQVPTKLVKDGENRVDFKLEGNGHYVYTATLRGFSPEINDPKSWLHPYIHSRKQYHAPLEYRGRQIARSTTEITQLPYGERTYVSVDIRERYSKRYFIVDEYLPAGTMLVNDSISGNYSHYEVGDGMIIFYYPPGRHLRNYRYQLVSYAPGSYRVLPTVIRDAMKPGEMRIGMEAKLEVLEAGEKSVDKYQMNDGELYGLGKAYFDDGKYADSLPLLSKLYERNPEYNQRELSRMLLWIYTEESYYDPRKVIEQFEILRERFPELYIPFDKIVVVGRAYRDIEEFERAYLVYKATIDASFVSDSNLSAVLEDEGQFLSSIDFQENLWREYPDSPQVISSYFAISQAIYSKVPEVDNELRITNYELRIKEQRGDTKHETRNTAVLFTSRSVHTITKLDLLKETVTMLSQFLTLYPNDPLADDASFSMANALLDLSSFPKVVKLCRSAQKRYPKSEYLTSFQYVEALGLFSQQKYDSAIEAAKTVADSKSKDQNLARYILGQIYHARGNPKMAIDWYQKVEEVYPDARESISYFKEKSISIDEVNVFRPNEKAKIKFKYRNIKSASLQIYRVDLMKLYLREKNLSKIRQIRLAGIEPEFSKTVTLGDGKDYVDKEHEVDLELKEEGAYLVICRGDELFTSGLVLFSPLDIEVQEDRVSGRVRVNVKDVVSDTYKEGVHLKVIGSADKEFRTGETDLRGLFIADNIRGKATVIAREDRNLYAFYRGKQWLGPTETEGRGRQTAGQSVQQKKYKADYRENIEMMNKAIQGENFMRFDNLRRSIRKGVQVQNSY